MYKLVIFKDNDLVISNSIPYNAVLDLALYVPYLTEYIVTKMIDITHMQIADIIKLNNYIIIVRVG